MQYQCIDAKRFVLYEFVGLCSIARCKAHRRRSGDSDLCWLSKQNTAKKSIRNAHCDQLVAAKESSAPQPVIVRRLILVVWKLQFVYCELFLFFCKEQNTRCGIGRKCVHCDVVWRPSEFRDRWFWGQCCVMIESMA